ncbi:hypothetical protein PVK06_026732 [Gossypium arboreum]|uniref:UBN2 domain-containing protein n=1 Tax=Gossypium arboreum TaxID=29729 RepID=A0ABR0NZ08_GOSAR|nr:hypothetical protein PVK06_026732 [Gossypium arboreum]
MFKKKLKKDIKAMFDRFTIIINEIKSYRTYPNEEVVRKMLKCLSMSWESKVTAIEEAKILETLLLDEQIGSLLIHEIRLKKGNKKEKVKKKKKVGVALKSTIEEDSDYSEEVDEDKEMTMFAR